MVVLIALLMLALCVPATAESAAIQSVSYEEAYGKSFRFMADCLETENALYLFENVVDEETRQACVAATEYLLEKIPLTKGPEICVVSSQTFGGVMIEGNRLYVSPMDWSGVEYAALVLQAVGGEYSHYGLAYGFASLLLGDEGAFVQPEALPVFDLNLLCFDADFVSAADASAAQKLACAFAADYIAVHGEDAYLQLLCGSGTVTGMESVAEALRLYYEYCGFSIQPATLRISQGGSACQYRVRLDGAEVWVSREWRDGNWTLNPLVSETFLHDSYGEVREFFCINERQMASYRHLFGVERDDGLTILLPRSLPGLSNSCYQAGEHRIMLLNVDSLMHEYIHALTRPDEQSNLWENEGLARYFSYYYDRYGIAMLNEDYNSVAETAQSRYVHEYRRKVGRPIDMAVDFGEIESVIAYTRGYESPNVNYASGAAFVHYLVQRYGEAAVIQYVLMDEPFDAPLPELVADWKRYLAENYHAYTRYSPPQPAMPPKLPPGKSGK